MPSVGMRRTRVFGVVKGVDGARVLRSGRRLWPESGDAKLKKSKDAGHWFQIVDNRGDSGRIVRGRLDCNWSHVRNVNPKRVSVADIHGEDDNCVIKVPKPVQDYSRTHGNGDSGVHDKMFGKVYTRKRKRHSSQNLDASDDMDEDNAMSGDRMFGIRFVRRQRTRKSQVHFSGRSVSAHRDSVLTIVTETRSDRGWLAEFNLSVLRYMRSSVLRVTELSAFLLSDPIHGVFASNGINFLQDYPSTLSSGICMIYDAIQSVPMFFLNFSAVPLCFMYLHSSIFLRAAWMHARLVNNSVSENTDIDLSSDSEEECKEKQHVTNLHEGSSLGRRIVAFGGDDSKGRAILHPSVRSSRLVGWNMQYRSGFSSYGIQKRRSSMRMRRRKNHSLAAIERSIGTVASEAFHDVKRGLPIYPMTFCGKRKNSALSGSTGRVREAGSSVLASSMDIESSCCNANILILESDKCFREEGANIVLEFSSSCQWVLAVKKDGSTRYTLKAENVMRPCSCNRFTHAIIWSGDNGWKLEFPNRQDWLHFKDMYKKCSDRNVLDSSAKTIPVPGVREVPDYVDSSSASFCRPESYISVNEDEVHRAMAKTMANYDMDSDDERWLNKFNDEHIAEDKDEHHECISNDNFELMIDALEKGLYCNPDAFSHEKPPADFCIHLGTKEILESVFAYWIKKRRQKKSPLVRFFQAHQVKKKPPVVQKPVLRRRRSLKRLPKQSGGAKQPNILQATVPKQNVMEDENVLLKFEEAKAKLNKSNEMAASKRQRAQALLENADLAAYKAMMALRIAEAIQVSEMPEAAASNFLE